MIDLHCHVLPGVDDGAHTIEESLEFGRVAARERLGALVATPHWDGTEERLPLTVEQIQADVLRVRQVWRERGLSVEVRPGAELRLSRELPAAFAAGQLPPLGGVGSRLLIELPYQYIPPFAEEVFFQLRLRGAIVVLAHPERNWDITSNPDKLERLAGLGHETMVNAGSLLGEHGAEVRRAAETAIREGWATYLASDAHRPEHLRRLRRCRRRVDRLAGSGVFERLTQTAPAAALSEL